MDLETYITNLKNSLVTQGSFYVSVWARPSGKVTRIKELVEEVLESGEISYHLKIELRSVPENGKANTELLEFLADIFGVRKQNISLVSGQADTRKIVFVKI